MKLRSTLFTSALGAFVALASCSDDTSKKVPFGMGEAGEAGSPSEGGTGGNGGRGGSPAKGGTANGGTAGLDVGPELTGGAAGSETTTEAGAAGITGGGPAPALLFTVASDAVGIAGTPVAASTRRASTLFGSISATPDEVTGTNDVRMTGAELGLATGDAILSFAVLQPTPAHPLYWFSVGPNEGGEGESPTRLSYSSAANQALGDVYFSDATLSYRNLGEGSDMLGYNALVADEQSLGLSPDTTTRSGPTHEDNLTGVGALPSGLTPRELYFTVGPSSTGVAGSAVEATPQNERSCTIFHTLLGGTNTVAYHCADLGLAPGSQITGLVLYGSPTPTEALFTVASGAIGLGDSAVAGSETPSSSIFTTPLDGTNALKVEARALGIYANDSLDALAVVDQAAPSYSYADSCTATVSPFSAAGANLLSIDSVRDIGRDLVLLAGPLATNTALEGIGAYKLSTCAFVAATTLPLGTISGETWAPVPTDAWSETTPFSALEFWQLADDASNVKRFDATGTLLDTFPLEGIDPDTVDAARLNYDATYDRFYGVINTHTTELNYTRIAFVHSVGRPDGTPVTTVATALPHPCAYNPYLSGIDDNGNSVYAQIDSEGVYRVCSFSFSGEFAGIPFLWQPQNQHDLAVLAPGKALYSINPGTSVSIDRYTQQ